MNAKAVKAKRGAPEKPCIACGKKIHARSLKCKHCGALQPIKTLEHSGVGSAKRGSKAKALTVENLKAALFLVNKHFGGDFEKAKQQLELLREIGSIDETLAAITEVEWFRAE